MCGYNSEPVRCGPVFLKTKDKHSDSPLTVITSNNQVEAQQVVNRPREVVRSRTYCKTEDGATKDFRETNWNKSSPLVGSGFYCVTRKRTALIGNGIPAPVLL